jgi:lipoate-protein ligase A
MITDVQKVYAGPKSDWAPRRVLDWAAGRIEDDVEVASCGRGGVPLARRSSGGGTVLLGPGCLLYSLVLRYDRAPELRDIRKSYRWILSRLTGALPGLTVEEQSDLAYSGRKVGGSAQQRKHNHLLHHGTLLYAFDLPLIGWYLKEPPRQPDYRGRRPHAEFVGNLPAEGAALRGRLRAAWGATPAGRPLPMELIARLVDEKYSRPEWVRRR